MYSWINKFCYMNIIDVIRECSSDEEVIAKANKYLYDNWADGGKCFFYKNIKLDIVCEKKFDTPYMAKVNEMGYYGLKWHKDLKSAVIEAMERWFNYLGRTREFLDDVDSDYDD